MERLCLDCNQPVKGRTDKKFCDDACRNNYNNRIKSEDNHVIKHINAILKRNRAILAALNPMGKTRVSLKKLQLANFNFEYHTNIYTTQTGNTYYFIYEYGFMSLSETEFLLVKRDEN